VRADDGSVRQLRAFAEPVTGPAGDLLAVRGAYQDVSPQFHTQAAFEVAREQLADTEERAREEHWLAVRLQQAITPQSSQLVEAVGLDVTARYRPAGPGHLVSGDWYDAVLLPTNEVLLAVGDVAGHGIEAVTGMVSLRNFLRGLAITGAGPGTLLGWLNSAAYHLADDIYGTAICGTYDPRNRTLRWARAGHLPPVVVRSGTARTLTLPQGMLLGAEPDASYQEATISLRPGDALLMFTDGLIERRDQSLDDALHALTHLASRPVHDIGTFADHLLARSPSDTGDDACLVAVAIQ
jgi:serine phosphatase RsbU (regulator of sigma subunit)